MCGIMITKNTYMGQMQHRGIKTRMLHYAGMTLVHEHLPIQATIEDNSIIETKEAFILFNGELFDIPEIFENDLDLIKSIFDDPNIYLTDKVKKIMEYDGFYSFLVHYKMSGATYAFTDPLGKKQLYYSDEAIASEIRPLVNGYSMRYDKLFMAHTIKFGYVTDDRTPYNEIKRVLPNRVYKFNSNMDRIHIGDPLEKFEPAMSECPEGFLVNRQRELRDIIREAVRSRLVGHEKIGLLLSGGLDSSIIYHHIKELGAEVTTYCVDNEADLKYARMMDPDVYVIGRPMVHDEAIIAMEMPVDLGSMYAQYDLFASTGERVIITGDGADELFGGYKRTQTYDSQMSDIFEELPFYHNIRIDRMSMWHTKEARSPFMALNVVRYALGLPYEQRIDKLALREAYRGILPDEIVDRPKEPLKSDIVRGSDQIYYRSELVKKFKEI